MADIFDAVLSQSNNAPKGDIFDEVLSTKQKQGGEQANEEQIRNQSQANSDRNAGREANQQVDAVGGEANLQADGMLRTEDQSKRQRNDQASQRQRNGNSVQLSQGDIFDQVLSKGGDLNAKQENAKAKDGYGSQVWQEGGQGLRSQRDEGNQAQVTGGEGGVLSPALAAGASAAETRVGLLAGKAAQTLAGKLIGSVAAAAAIPLDVAETIATGGVGALAVPAIEMGAFAAGSYVGDKATQFVEKLIGADKAIEKAKQENPIISEVASLATMAPMALGSLKGLAKIGAEEGASAVAKKVGGSVIGGAAFEPIRYGVESAIKSVTGDKTPVSPVTLGSTAKSALIAGVLSAHGAREIESTIGPATARAAVITPTEQAAKAAQQTKEYAPEIRKVEEGNLPEYKEGDQVGKTTETSGGDRIVESRKEQEEVKPIILSAAFKPTEDSIPYRAKSHPEAIEQAVADGVITQEQADKFKDAKDRNRPEFGFMVKMPDGKIEFKDRKEATDIARQSGQIKEETLTPENTFTDADGNILLHSNQTEQAAHKETKKLPGAAAVSEFEDKDTQLGVEIHRGNPDISFEDWKKKFEPAVNEYAQKEGGLAREKGELEYQKYSDDQLKDIYNTSKEASKSTAPAPQAVQNLRLGARMGATAVDRKSIDDQRQSMGLSRLYDIAKDEWKLVWDRAMNLVEDKPQYTYELIDRLKKNPNAPIDTTDRAILHHEIINVKNEYDDLIESLNTEKDPSRLASIRSRLLDVENKYLDLTDLSRLTARGTAQSLNMMKAIINDDFTKLGMLRRAKAEIAGRDEEKGGSELSPEARAKIEEQATRIEELNKRIAELESGVKEENQSTDLEDFTKKAKINSQSESQKPKKVGDMTPDEKIEKYLSDIRERRDSKESLGTLVRSLAKAIHQKAFEGGTDLNRNQLADATHRLVSKEMGEDWTEEQTKNAITGYGIFKQLTKDAVEKSFRAVNGELREIGKQADIRRGEAPRKTGVERAEKGAKERIEIKKNNALIKKLGIQTKDPETQLAGAMNAIKNRLRNHIEELTQRIETGERAPKKEGVEYDAEAKTLKAKRDELQQAFDTLYGKEQKTYEEKVKAAEIANERLIEAKKSQIDQERDRILNGRKVTPEEREKITSDRIDVQKTELDQLNQELKTIRDSDYVRKEEIKKANSLKRINEIKAILSGNAKAREEKESTTASKELSEVLNQLASSEKELKDFRDSQKVRKTEDQKKDESLQRKLENAEDELSKIQSGIKDVKTGRVTVDTEAQAKKKAEIKEIQDQLKEYRDSEKVRKTDEEKRISSLERRIENLKKIREEKKLPSNTKKEFDLSDEEKALQAEYEELKSSLKSDEWYIDARQKIAIQSYISRISKQIVDYKRRMVEKDFATRNKKNPISSKELEEAKIERAKIKSEFEQDRILDRWKNRGKWEKSADLAVGWKRAAVLSYITTAAKLSSAAAEIAAFQPIEVGSERFLGALPGFKQIAKLAPTEGGGKISEDVAAFSKGLWSGLKEVKDIALKQQDSRLTLLQREIGGEAPSKIPKGLLGIPGKIHEAIKNPIKVAVYEKAFSRYLNFEKAKNDGIVDEAAIQRASIAAFQHAERRLFLEDNAVVKMYSSFINQLKQSKVGGIRAAGYAAEELIPIVKIPTNIVKQVFEYQFGAGIATTRMIKAINKGLENVTPEEADSIMLQAKRGSVGLFMMALGAALPQAVGGFYRKDAQPAEGEPGFDEVKIGDYTIPKYLMHNPALIALQIGATMRKIWDDGIEEADGLSDQAKLAAKGLYQSQMGLVEELPFVGVSRQFGEYLDPKRSPEVAGNLVRSNIPGFIQETAKWIDRDDDGNLIKRKPETFLETIEQGLPWLREFLEQK
jgi:hypothetical protein